MGGSILLLTGWKQTPEIKYFTSTPDFLAWTVLASILFGILPLCAIYGLLSIQKLKQWKYLSSSVFPLLILSILFFLPTILMSQFPSVFPRVDLPSFELRVNFIVLFSGLCVIPANISLILLNRCIQALSPKSSAFPREYLKLKEQLEMLLGIIGLIIGLGTLTTGGLQNTLTAFYKGYGVNLEGAFPPIFTVIYGGYFTTVLIVMYLPLERSLIELAKSFIDLHVNLSELRSGSWSSEYDKLKKAEEWLQLSNDWINLRTTLTIFTPLIGGLISYIIPK